MGFVYPFVPVFGDGRAVLFRADASSHAGGERLPPASELRILPVPGDHYSIMRSPHVRRLAAALSAELPNPTQAEAAADRNRESLR
jgi:hypothetical protein